MSLEATINEDIKNAMRAKDSLKLEVLRGVKSQLKYYLIEKKTETPSDEDVTAVLKKLIKQRNDSIEQFKKGNRPELAEKETAELSVLQKYLPLQMPREELEKIIRDSIAELKITEKKQMGQVIRHVIEKAGGRADGRDINQIASQLLK